MLKNMIITLTLDEDADLYIDEQELSNHSYLNHVFGSESGLTEFCFINEITELVDDFKNETLVGQLADDVPIDSICQQFLDKVIKFIKDNDTITEEGEVENIKYFYQIRHWSVEYDNNISLLAFKIE